MPSQMVLAILGSTISKRFRKKFNCRTDRKVVPEKVVTRRWTLALSVDGLIKVGCEQGQPKPRFDIISYGMIWYRISRNLLSEEQFW